MNLRFLVLIRGMWEGGELKTFLHYPRGVWELPISLFSKEVTYLVCVDFLYLIKPMLVGFCWRCNWTVGSSINVLTDLILFRYQTAIKYTINFNY